MSGDPVQRWNEDKATQAHKRANHMHQNRGAAAVPRAVDIEVSVLSLMMEDIDIRDMAFGFMGTNHEVFYDGKHQAVFKVIHQLHSNGELCSMIEVNQGAEKMGLTTEMGGASYLVELSGAYADKFQAQKYVMILMEKYYLRQVIRLSVEMKAKAMDPSQDPFELIDYFVNQGLMIADLSERQDFVKFEHLIKYLEAAVNGDEADMGIGTPWKEFNNLVGGFFKTDLVYVAARPGMGKTAFMGNSAVHIAENGIGVGIVSLEMSELQLVKRVAAQEAKVDSFHLRTNNLDDDEKAKIKVQIKRLRDLKLWIDDTPGQTIYNVIQKIRKLKRQNPEVEVVYVDYIGLMNDPMAMNREQEIAGMSRMLKNLAKELNIVIVCLAQLSRACEGRADKRPILSDLRDSGGQEQDADVVMFIYRHEYYEPQDEAWQGIGEFITRKNRHGPIGPVIVAWLAQFTRFENFSGRLPDGNTVEQARQASVEERLLDSEEI